LVIFFIIGRSVYPGGVIESKQILSVCPGRDYNGLTTAIRNDNQCATTLRQFLCDQENNLQRAVAKIKLVWSLLGTKVSNANVRPRVASCIDVR
jgi:hypothetical protein